MAKDILGILLGVVLIVVLLQQPIVKDFIGTTEDAPAEPEDIRAECIGVDGVTVTLNAVDALSAGTSTPGSNYYKILNGGTSSVKSVSDAGTFEASVGDKVQYWMQLEDLDSSSGTHYATAGEVTLPCASTYEITGEVYNNQNITYKLFADDGNLLARGATAGQNLTLGAGASETVSGTVYGVDKRGMPHGGVMVLDYSRGNFSSGDFVLNIDGVALKRATVPTSHQSKSAQKASIGFEFPAIIGVTPHSFALTMQLLSSQNINAPKVFNDENALNFTLYDNAYFQTDEGNVMLGPEDTDDNSDVGDTDNNKFGFWVD